MKQLQQQVFDVFADVAGFGERRRIADGERDLQVARQSPREQRFSTTGRTDQHDVRLFNFDILVVRLVVHQPLVMVVDGDGEYAFGLRLTDDVFVEVAGDFARRGHLVEQFARRPAAAALLVENRLAQLDALAADVNVVGTFNQRTDFAVTLAAKRTIGVFFSG